VGTRDRKSSSSLLSTKSLPFRKRLVNLLTPYTIINNNFNMYTTTKNLPPPPQMRRMVRTGTRYRTNVAKIRQTTAKADRNGREKLPELEETPFYLIESWCFKYATRALFEPIDKISCELEAVLNLSHGILGGSQFSQQALLWLYMFQMQLINLEIN